MGSEREKGRWRYIGQPRFSNFLNLPFPPLCSEVVYFLHNKIPWPGILYWFLHFPVHLSCRFSHIIFFYIFSSRITITNGRYLPIIPTISPCYLGWNKLQILYQLPNYNEIGVLVFCSCASWWLVWFSQTCVCWTKLVCKLKTTRITSTYDIYLF